MKKVLIWIAIIVMDLSVFVILGLLLMKYDDFYDESKGEYWSLESMTTQQKTIYILNNLWGVLNVIVVLCLIGRTLIKSKIK